MHPVQPMHPIHTIHPMYLRYLSHPNHQRTFLSFGSSLIRKSSITSVCKSFAGCAPNIIITYTHGEIKERYKTDILRDIAFSKLGKKLEKEL